MPPLSRARDFFAAYTQDLTSDELSRLFTRDTPEAARFFTRGVDSKAFRALPWHRRGVRWTQAFFMAFAMRLTPARRVIYGVALLAAAIGVMSLFRGISVFGVPIIIPPFFFRIGVPTLAFAPGTQWLIFAFALMNLLVLLEVFDRLSLKRDLEVAREIQLAMLPDGTWAAPGVEASGLTRPANTVGGDFYDILPQPDGRVIVALGDVAGKASPAALLMALFLAMLRTLADEHLALTELVRRLNIQVSKHAPPSRFITLFLGLFDPRTGELEYVNAGQTPPLLLRASGAVEKLLHRRHRAGDVRAVDLRGRPYPPRSRRRADHVQRRHHRGRSARRPDVRGIRAGSRRPGHAGRGRRRARPGGVRRGGSLSAGRAARRRPHGAGAEPADRSAGPRVRPGSLNLVARAGPLGV